MSIFGKVLAFLNILAALGFLLFAILDWGARANWQYTNWRYDLYSNGLPLDNTEKTLDGDRIDEMLDQKTLSDIFTTIGGSPQKTQVDEVKRVQPIITTYITAAPSAAEKQALTEELQKTLGAQRPLNDIRIADLRRQIDLAKQAKPPLATLPSLERELKELEENQAKINSSLEKLSGAGADSFLAQIQLERRFGEVLLPFSTTSVEYEEMVRHKFRLLALDGVGDFVGDLLLGLRLGIDGAGSVGRPAHGSQTAERGATRRRERRVSVVPRDADQVEEQAGGGELALVHAELVGGWRLRNLENFLGRLGVACQDLIK